MDLSKLPKLSDTKGQTPASSESPPVNVVSYQPIPPRPAGIGGEIWISLIMGLVFIYIGSNFARFAASTITRNQFHTNVNWTSGPKEGTEVSYFDLEGFTAWSDMGIFLFGLTLLFEALAKTLISIKPGNVSRFALMLAMALTFVAVALNIIVCMKLLGVGITPLMSAVAIAFGGWILFDEWATLRRLGNA